MCPQGPAHWWFLRLLQRRGAPEQPFIKTYLAIVTQVAEVACGAEVSYALTAQGGVYAWGFGENMQLGNGAGADEETESLLSPTKLEGQALEVSRCDGAIVSWCRMQGPCVIPCYPRHAGAEGAADIGGRPACGAHCVAIVCGTALARPLLLTLNPPYPCHCAPKDIATPHRIVLWLVTSLVSLLPLSGAAGGERRRRPALIRA
jgi:hypothetical protein